MDRLDIFPLSVLTQNKRIVMMKNLVVIRKIKRVRPYPKISLRKRRKTSFPKRILTMKVKMQNSYLWDNNFI